MAKKTIKARPALVSVKTETESNHSVDKETVRIIRHALLIGLESFGEIERLQNAADIFELGGEKVPEHLKAIHPTGAADTVCDFASALRALEHAESEASQRARS